MFESLDASSQNLLVHGKELTIYYIKNHTVDSQEPCRFCGEKPAYAVVVNVTSVFDGCIEVKKGIPLFNEAQAVLRRKELHGKVCCVGDLCQKKDSYELMGGGYINDVAMGHIVPEQC